MAGRRAGRGAPSRPRRFGLLGAAAALLLLAPLSAGDSLAALSEEQAKEKQREQPSQQPGGQPEGQAAQPDPAAVAEKAPHPHPHELRKLMDRIPLDLAPWKHGGITQEMVEHTYCTDFPSTFRLQIVDGHGWIVGERPGFSEFNRLTKVLITDVLKHHKVPDVDVIFTTTDRCPTPVKPFAGNLTACPESAPLFAFDKHPDTDRHCVLFPDFTFGSGGWPLAKLPDWQTARHLLDLGHVHPSSLGWDQRIQQLFFRGAPTGNRGILGADANFTALPEVNFSLTGYTGLTAPEQFVALPDHCKYQYLLHLPGNGWSVRLKYLLLCGSTVVFANDNMQEFWSHLLQDGVHLAMTPHVSDRAKGSEIVAKLRELQADAPLAARIAAEGRGLVTRLLTPATVYGYFAELLRQYAELQTFRPRVHADAVPLHVSAMGADALHTAESRTCGVCGLR